MPDCAPFRLYVGEQLQALMPIVLHELKRRGGTVTGTGDRGRFSIGLPVGTIRGTFEISGKSLAIEISHRPNAVTCGTIESKLQDAILDAKAVLRNQQEE